MRGTRSGIPPSELDAFVLVPGEDAVARSPVRIAVREEGLVSRFAVARKDFDAAVGHVEDGRKRGRVVLVALLDVAGCRQDLEGSLHSSMPRRAPGPADRRMFARDGSFAAIFVPRALCLFVVQTGQARYTTALILLQDLGVGLLETVAESATRAGSALNHDYPYP
jgi:hypothetical protein